VVKDIKDKSKNKWINRYQNIARKFHDEEYEQTNREARDFISELNSQSVRNILLSLEIYIIGIDASIRAGNPDISLIEEATRLADNDTTILLRSLAIKIQEFDVNRRNDIIVKDVLNDICILGREIEEKIYEKFKFTNDQS
jgi:hypothetical protein